MVKTAYLRFLAESILLRRQYLKSDLHHMTLLDSMMSIYMIQLLGKSCRMKRSVKNGLSVVRQDGEGTGHRRLRRPMSSTGEQKVEASFCSHRVRETGEPW